MCFEMINRFCDLYNHIVCTAVCTLLNVLEIKFENLSDDDDTGDDNDDEMMMMMSCSITNLTRIS